MEMEMNKTLSAVLLVLTAAAAPAWAQDKTYIVRFKDNAVPQVKERSVHDDRLANDEGWAHVGERVMGHVQTLEKRHGVRAEAAFGTVFKGMSARLTPAQRQALQRDPSVDVIEEEQIFSIKPTGQVSATATVSTQSIPWGISKTEATQSYTLAGNGSGAIAGVRAYIIDTGIDTKNSDLNRAGHINFAGDGRNTDCNGHGTHVAGTVAAADNKSAVVGMGPGVAVYGVKVLNCQGSGTTTSVIKGVDWVAANAIKPAVANMSLGGGVSQLLDDAVRNAASKGIFFSIAAGNSATQACNSSPARVGGGGTPGVMVAAATDVNDLEASFSNYGACVDIWAPGVNVTSLKLGGGTVAMSGTSMASPHVGGAAALYLGRYPTATSSGVVSYLKQMAVQTGTLSKDGRALTRLSANVQ
ncbi:MAG: S8 family peptidase [Limnohabitans sp.]|nr:MAG: S8 family peptidase [Limnohabitans sp.]